MIAHVLQRTRLLEHRSALFRAGWLLTAALFLILFPLTEWFLYAELQVPCAAPCLDPTFYLAPADIPRLEALGLSARFYAGWQVGLYVLFFAVHLAIAGLISSRKPNDRMARLAAFSMLVWSGAFTGIPYTLWQALPAAAAVMTIAGAAGGVLFWTFFFVFPDGRFAPPWMRWIIAVLLIYALLDTTRQLTSLLSGSLLERVLAPVQPLIFPTATCIAIATQIYRYVRVSNAAERQQTRWVFFGIVLGLGFSLTVALYFTFVNPAFAEDVVGKMVVTALIYAGFLMVPLSIGVAILRARLWEIDLILNRALVYGTLTASVVGLYVLVVGYLSTLFQTSGNLLISLVATGLIAVLFQPLRARLQREVDRLLYGERADPYAALARLGQRLESTLAPEAVLPTIVQTVREALNLPYAAIALLSDERGLSGGDAGSAAGEPHAALEIVAASGTLAKDLLRLPLVYQNEQIGELLLSPRGPGEGFTAADRRLLDDLARQAGVAAHAVRLTAALQRARARLVAAREEERRRIRRDLHDGLGPQLASQTLTIDAIFKLLPHDPAAARGLLQHLKTQSQQAIADIRRLVYALRPPALDDLGLLAALRAQAAQYDGSEVQIAVVAPAALPPLPAAVEVAAYRIAQEAMTNVVKHAGAQRCVVELALADGLVVTIADDGRGLAAERRAGVGLISMQERAAELGGRLSIGERPGGGTRVAAWLPLPTPERHVPGEEATETSVFNTSFVIHEREEQ